MTFLELQRRIVQTRKARKGVKNRTDYFADCSWQVEQGWRKVYDQALQVASKVVEHYEGAFDDSVEFVKEKAKVCFGEEKKNNDYFDDYTKGLKAYAELERTYQELHKMYVEQTNELLELQQKAGSLSRELDAVQRELVRVKKGGRHKDYMKEAKIQLYKHEHPDASIRAIAKAVGCSTTTVQNALKTIRRDENGTLSVMNIPKDRKKARTND